jgi:ankyrin repeat protein
LIYSLKLKKTNTIQTLLDWIDNNNDVFTALLNTVFDHHGRNALHMVTHKTVAVRMISNGININAVANNGKTPIIYAITVGNIEIIKLLIDAGVDLNARYYI